MTAAFGAPRWPPAAVLTGCFVLQGEFKVTERPVVMQDLLAGLQDGRVLEVFGAGTACVVCPVGSLLYRGQVSVSVPPRPIRLTAGRAGL